MLYEHGGNVWSSNQKTGIAPQKIFDFSANLNPLGPPAGVLKLLKEKINFIRFYPEPNAKSFRSAVATKLELSSEQVIVGNGASELISLFFWVFRPKKVLIPAPAYSDYTRASRSAGAKVKYFFFNPGDHFASSLDAIADEVISRRPDAFVFCNPNNPTGVFWEDVSPLLKASALKGIPFLLDVSFLPFADVDWRSWLKQDDFIPFWRDEGTDKSFLFLVFSLTKIYALPGLRLGIGIGSPSLISKMEAAKDPWSVNSLAQLAGLQCLQEQLYLAKSLEIVRKEREYLHRSLNRLPGLRPFGSRANFLLVN
ncbi:MAG: aminotransferase class I/II-fold pyridoxal phosphate-dependent enzyme, partial [Firmicutes bacterium]|nr:aminotransferase class I/II-fold pyridoxal phosphate-dependent enzyme [Bacillota bacterium]